MAADSIRTAGQVISNFMGFSLKNRFSLRRSYDIHTCKEMVANRRLNSLVKLQQLKNAEHAEFGSDVAVAKFAMRMGGRVKTCDSRWISESSKLPTDFNETFKLTAIEITRSSLVTEGIDNLVGLEHIKSINLSNNFLLDDFACDQLSRQFRTSNTLEELDLNEIPYITINGIEALLRIPSLRKISAIGTQACKFEDIDLFALAAQDECNCKIIVHEDGRQFRSKDLEEAFAENVRMLEANKTAQITAA